MRHIYIGELDGPVLLFGGPYSNAQATRAVLDVARDFSHSNVICTGDIVAYCGGARDAIAMIRDSGVHVVAGNCEVQLAANALDCGCGFEDGSACDLLSAGWYAFADREVSEQDRNWMGTLPDIISFDHHGARYAVVHGGATDVARFIWESDQEAVFAEEWDAIEAAIGPVNHVIAGHCGVPFVRDTARGRWMNAGVVGMPPHDGSDQTRYATLVQGMFEIKTLTYDVAGAVADMERAGLVQGYHTALGTGYWPSEDVLPQSLRVSGLVRG